MTPSPERYAEIVESGLAGAPTPPVGAARGAALIAELIRRGVLGTDPCVLHDLLDLCLLAGVDAMPIPPTDDSDFAEPGDYPDDVAGERDLLRAENARLRAVLAEYEARVAADRAEYLRRVRELEAQVSHLKAGERGLVAMRDAACRLADERVKALTDTELRQRDLDAKVYAGMIAEMNHAREQRDAALARVAELEAALKPVSKPPDAVLDMAMLEQPEGAVPPGSRSGEAVAWKERQRGACYGVPDVKKAS